MNGAVYISFFQGQLESVLEQVVQLAVQELSKTVGSSLNGLLLETAVKEQENRRLQLQIQARESDRGAPAKGKAAEERHDGGQARQHTSGPGLSSDRGLSGDSRRLEQRGRVVEQLKSVMQRVLEFAVSELTKIVEASFDDLLLEITKMEKEQQSLEERLGLSRSMERASARDRSSSNRGRRNSENDSMSPSGSEDNREDTADKENLENLHREPRPSELASSQDWVPILDKVFGQKWCGDAWSAEQLEAGVSTETADSGRGSAAAPPLSLEPRPSSPQQDPRWTPLEDMEVFSPDEEEVQGPVTLATASTSVTTATTPTTTTASGSAPGNKARRSSASMLHRLLTLPSQLLEEEDADDSELENIAVSMATEAAAAGVTETARSLASPSATRDEDDEEEDEEEEEERRKRKRRRVWSECEDCGRRFSRVSLLKAHRQTHLSDSPPPPGQSPAPSLRCDDCGKRFSSHTRLQSHVQTSHSEKRA